jgi:Uncharacterised nucleotidyltransferase
MKPEIRPGMQSLLDLLHGDACIRDVSEQEWMRVLDLAEQENVLPWTVASLRSLFHDSMPKLADRLHAIHRNARISTFLWTASLRSTLADFHRRGIPVISLKGPWLAERLYGDASLRSCCDLDLLVHRSDIAVAADLLTDLGFLPSGRPDDYARPFHRGSISVELHHDVENPLAFNFDVEAAWSRARYAEFQGVPARLLAPADELLFLCLHGTRHRFERLSHILDLVFAFRNLPLPQTAPRSRHASESGNILALSAMMANRLDPRLQIPDCLCDRIENRQSLHQLADQLWQERMLQPAAVLDWRAKHDFYLAIETRRWNRLLRHIRHARILLTRLIDADFAFAQRFNLTRSWQVWLLRPLRLLLSAVRTLPTSP